MDRGKLSTTGDHSADKHSSACDLHVSFRCKMLFGIWRSPEAAVHSRPLEINARPLVKENHP